MNRTVTHYNVIDGFNVEWDKEKEQKNIKAHKVSFDVALSALKYPIAIEEDNDHYELRFRTIGLISGSVALLLVVHTYPNEQTIRIISARKLSKKEGKHYGIS